MSEPTPTRNVSAWLSAFGAALERDDIAAAVAMFDDDCYWRDLVSFTWNIRTQEGKQSIREMLAATLPRGKPRNWQVEGVATEAGGVTEAWFTFETAVARGKGHLRLKGDKCWTLLTTMTELKGFEEPKGAARAKGVEHGVFQERKTWLERKKQEEAELGISRQPYVVIIGGGQGGIGIGARLKRLGVPATVVAPTLPDTSPARVWAFTSVRCAGIGSGGVP
jgi:putative flavoprotein involved in K+ transport